MKGIFFFLGGILSTITIFLSIVFGCILGFEVADKPYKPRPRKEYYYGPHDGRFPWGDK